MKDKGNSQQFNIFADETILTTLVLRTSQNLIIFFPSTESSIDTGAELSEIDARLQALQEYMRDLDTGH